MWLLQEPQALLGHSGWAASSPSPKVLTHQAQPESDWLPGMAEDAWDVCHVTLNRPLADGGIELGRAFCALVLPDSRSPGLCALQAAGQSSRRLPMWVQCQPEQQLLCSATRGAATVRTHSGHSSGDHSRGLELAPLPLAQEPHAQPCSVRNLCPNPVERWGEVQEGAAWSPPLGIATSCHPGTRPPPVTAPCIPHPTPRGGPGLSCVLIAGSRQGLSPQGWGRQLRQPESWRDPYSLSVAVSLGTPAARVP